MLFVINAISVINTPHTFWNQIVDKNDNNNNNNNNKNHSKWVQEGSSYVSRDLKL